MRTRARYLLTLAVVFGVVAVGAAAADAQGILTSKHNLTYGGNTIHQTGSTNTEICVFCHTPHGADAAVKAPLWNRQVNATSSYTLYTSSHSSTLDANVSADGLGVSQACLSCHDGSIAFDALRNMPGSGNTAMTGSIAGTGGTNKMPAGITNLGTDLRDDHPIAISYVNSSGTQQAKSPSSANDNEDAGFTAASLSGTRYWVSRSVPNAGDNGNTASSISLPLYFNDSHWRVQCGTCHDPHRASASGQELFLRSTNNKYSKLCRTCHIKDTSS